MKTSLAVFLLILLTGCREAASQTVSGILTEHAGQEVRLEGFRGFDTRLISSGRVSDSGEFSLSYAGEQPGMALLSAGGGSPFVVVLSGEDIRLEGASPAMPETMRVVEGTENRLFEQYASEHPRREQALSAWIYLRTLYDADSLFAAHQLPREAIAAEIARIRAEDEAFLSALDPDTYISWYLPVRRLVSAVPVVAQFRTEEIPATIEAFRQLDHTEPRLYRSGLLADVLESHVWLIENSGRDLDAVFEALNRSADILTENLSADPVRFRELTAFLFELLERRSLFASSEHLARRLLTQYPELPDRNLRAKLEIYGAMRIGNTAPELVFGPLTHRPDGLSAESLSGVDADFVLVVFAAGWCAACREMLPELRTRYQSWREQGVEVVLVSLDDAPEAFEAFTAGLPFPATTDLKGWESAAALDWHVHSLPAFWLLDRDRRIILRPNSVRHAHAWVDWHLIQGNPIPSPR
ncbi:MAG: TlpA family protein disulfide reductase [Balneolales bacterium]|nr:TlpA family protein disulfide reductase [Balneolales bacterium]